MSIYTRSGDAGTTSLAGGARVSKADPRVEAYGDIDEAASCAGLARSWTGDVLLGDMLRFVQHRLHNCAARIATPPAERDDSTSDVSADDVRALELAVDRFMDAAGPFDEFVIEGGTRLSAQLQVARAVVRRAERRVVALAEPGDGHVAGFLNRLSDALFAAARYALTLEKASEEPWDPQAPPPAP